MMVFSGSSNRPLANKIAQKAGLKLGRVELSRFLNDEARVRILEKNPGKMAVVVQSMSTPSDHYLIEFLLICDGLKRLGVNKIIGVIPWLCYSKQDKVFRKGEPLSVKVTAEILDSVGMEKIICLDLHNQEIMKMFKTKVINLSALDLMINYFKNQVDKKTIVVAPDKGGIELSKKFAQKLGVKCALINKSRDLATGKVTVKGIKGEVKNKKVLIIDDILATGSTLVETVNYLTKLSVQLIKVGITHHLYLKEAQKRIEKSQIDQLVVTDSIKQSKKSAKLKQITIADLIADQI